MSVPDGGSYDLQALPPADWEDRGVREGFQIYELVGGAGSVLVKDQAGHPAREWLNLPPGVRVKIGGGTVLVEWPAREPK